MTPIAPTEVDDDALTGYCHAQPLTAHDLTKLLLPALVVAAGSVGLGVAAVWALITRPFKGEPA